MAVLEGGVRLLLGGGNNDRDVAGIESALGVSAIHAAQAGLIGDMDRVADALYQRQPQSGSLEGERR